MSGAASKSDVQWVRVSNCFHIARIEQLKPVGMNTYSATTDRTGAVIIPLGHDSKPDSDWGRYTRGNIIIRVTEEHLLSAVEAAVRKALKLPAGNVLFPADREASQ